MAVTTIAEVFGNTADINATVPGSSWIGDSPRLAEREEGRYGRLDTPGQVSGTKFVALEIAGVVGSALVATARFRLTTSDGLPRSSTFGLYGFDSGDNYAAYGAIAGGSLAGDGVWRESSGSIGVASTSAASFAACERFFLGVSIQPNTPDDDLVFDVDWIHFEELTAAEDAPKVRQLHRDDGRGMTPRRHFGGASRATTGRHFGYD